MAPGTQPEGRLALALCMMSLALAAAVILAWLPPALHRAPAACADAFRFTGPLGTPFVGAARCPPAP